MRKSYKLKGRTRKLGNPAAIAVASNPDLIKKGGDIIINSQKQMASVARILIYSVAGIATAWYLNKKFKDWQRQKFVEENANLPDVQAAMIMRKAMFKVEFTTFPFNFVAIPDGTNEAVLYALALKVSSLQAVTKAYKILFDSNLITDVANELSDVEMIRFFENIGAGSDYDSGFNQNGTIKPQTPFRAGQTIEVKNPNGTTIWKALENANGTYRGSTEVRDFLAFSKEIGSIIAVYKGVSGQYYYVVDVSLSADWIFGHGWVAHTEVKIKI